MYDAYITIVLYSRMCSQIFVCENIHTHLHSTKINGMKNSVFIIFNYEIIQIMVTVFSEYL